MRIFKNGSPFKHRIYWCDVLDAVTEFVFAWYYAVILLIGLAGIVFMILAAIGFILSLFA